MHQVSKGQYLAELNRRLEQHPSPRTCFVKQGEKIVKTAILDVREPEEYSAELASALKTGKAQKSARISKAA